MKRTKIKGGYFHDGKGKQFTSLQDALANDTKCGCGVNCKEGFVSLPNFNSSSGDKEGFRGFYIVDGELVVDTISNIRSEISNFCNGGGDGGEPQALRLTFDSIENANLLVGDASNVADWNTFFDLPTYGNPFTSVEVAGNEVRLFGGSDITIKSQLFFNNFSILEVIDYLGSITELGDDCFNTCTSLTNVYFSNVLSGGNACFIYCYQLISITLPSIVSTGNDFLYECTNLTAVNMPILNSAGNHFFSYCTSLVSLNLPQLSTVGTSFTADCSLLTTLNLPNLLAVGSSAFSGCPSLSIINLPSCIDLGGTVGDDMLFTNTIGNNITLTVPAALMTANAGSPDGDIAYLQANNTVTVITT